MGVTLTVSLPLARGLPATFLRQGAIDDGSTWLTLVAAATKASLSDLQGRIKRRRSRPLLWNETRARAHASTARKLGASGVGQNYVYITEQLKGRTLRRLPAVHHQQATGPASSLARVLAPAVLKIPWTGRPQTELARTGQVPVTRPYPGTTPRSRAMPQHQLLACRSRGLPPPRNPSGAVFCMYTLSESIGRICVTSTPFLGFPPRPQGIAAHPDGRAC
jgi:hypothetical protein